MKMKGIQEHQQKQPEQDKPEGQVKRQEQVVDTGPADFETAIAATGYGRFNYLLLLVAMPCCIGTVFETTTMSYVLPSAECDLRLSLVDKGTLNAVTYGGMITSAFFWGFLSDTYGRKRLLVYGFLLDATFNVLCATSQSVLAIMIFKFMGGFIICGPFAVLMAYLSEFHSLQHRSRVMMMVGIFYSIANVLLPSLAWAIIPQSGWDFTLLDGKLAIHSWQIFLAVCCLPSLLSGACCMFFPESPKFLMAKGRNEQAMAVFRTLYALNTGRTREDYPIKELVDETAIKADGSVQKDQKEVLQKAPKISGLHSFQDQMRSMFGKTHLKNSLMAYSIQFGILFGLNTFRLWVPQLFTIIQEYELDPTTFATDGSLCDMLAYKVNKSAVLQESDRLYVAVAPASPLDTEELVCQPTTQGDIYLNPLIIGCVGVGAYLVTTVLINAIGNRNLLVYGLLTSGCCGLLLYWSKSSAIVLVLSATYITIASISSTGLVGSVVAMFPTSMRTMVVSLTMMFGRTGSIIGNVLFPHLMALGCWPPFLMIGSIHIVVALISTTLPRTIKKPLQ
uniref:Putative synaptic vesicle protein sv2 n=1 Tax=Culex tarsalis TaxID=7177 RepID=A0A1Q3FPY0_CULTA